MLLGSSLQCSVVAHWSAKPDGESQVRRFYSKHKKKLNPSNTSELSGPKQHAQCSFQFRCLNLACMNHPRVNLYPHLMCELWIFWMWKRQILEGEADFKWLQVWVIQSVLSYRAERVFKHVIINHPCYLTVSHCNVSKTLSQLQGFPRLAVPGLTFYSSQQQSASPWLQYKV